MGHQFTNFADAYSYMQTRWGQSRTQWVTCNTVLGFANDAWAAGNDHLAIQWLIAAGSSLANSVKYLADFLTTDYLQSELMECFYWANKDVEAAEFTMEVLLSTMVAAEPDELKYFVGLVDAYRQSLWNKPFNAEFYAAIAKGFE